jgi:hypothetical protein
VVLPGQEARGVVLGVARALGGKRMGRGGKHDGEGAGGHLRQGTCFAEDEPRGGLTWGAPVGRRGGAWHGGRVAAADRQRLEVGRHGLAVPPCEIGEAGTTTGEPYATVQGGAVKGSLNRFKI